MLKESEDAKLSVQETLEDKPPSTPVPSSRATKNQSERYINFVDFCVQYRHSIAVAEEDPRTKTFY